MNVWPPSSKPLGVKPDQRPSKNVEGPPASVTLPPTPSEPPADATKTYPPAPTPPAARVVIIDDSEFAREEMSNILREAGWEVVALPSPIGATQVIVRQQARVVVLDVCMPSLRGDRLLTLFRMARSSTSRRRTALGALLIPAYLIASSSAGISAPAVPHELRGAIILTRRRLRERVREPRVDP